MTHAAQTGLSVVAEAVTVSVPDGRGGPQRKTLLKDVTFRIEPGEFVCVLGPSGAGKSTLVRAILGEREMAAGRLLVGGHDVFDEADALRGAIGYVPQRDVNPPKPCRSSGRFTMHRRCDFRQKRPPRSGRPQSIGSSPRSASTGCGSSDRQPLGWRDEAGEPGSRNARRPGPACDRRGNLQPRSGHRGPDHDAPRRPCPRRHDRGRGHAPPRQRRRRPTRS
jgi:hypothetical protein